MYKIQKLLACSESFVDIYSTSDKEFAMQLCEEYRQKYKNDYFRVVEVIWYV